MALASIDRLTYSYPGSGPVLRDVSLELGYGEVIAVLGPSGSGKSTLLRALAGLVPHFHGGRFEGRVMVGDRDTRDTRPSELTGLVASVFQDPEDQVVMTVVENEVAFGLENVGVEPEAIWPRVASSLADVGIGELRSRRTHELSGGELQRLCLASALALRPQLLLLDEPTSQLDPDGAERFLELVGSMGVTVVLSEQRIGRALAVADRVLFVEEGRLVLDAPRERAIAWLQETRPLYLESVHCEEPDADVADRAPIVRLTGVGHAYRDGPSVLRDVELAVRPGEIVALEGPNGSGKTTLAKIAAGLLDPTEGTVARAGRAGYLSQDPGRYLARESVIDEVALAVGGDRERARPALARFGLEHLALRHPRDLSSGERERLAIASVAVAEPDLLVLDEPTRGVDPVRRAALAEWLARSAAQGQAILVATHDAGLPAHRRLRLGARREVVFVAA